MSGIHFRMVADKSVVVAAFVEAVVAFAEAVVSFVEAVVSFVEIAVAFAGDIPVAFAGAEIAAETSPCRW